MAVQIQALAAHGVFTTFGYFVIDDVTRHGFLIDPGAQAAQFAQAIERNGWTIEAILLTHGHFDHIGAVDALRREFGMPVVAHELSGRYLLDPQLNLSASHGMRLTLQGAKSFSDGDVLELSAKPGAQLQVLHVPGHTDDSCALYCAQAGAAFVGDTAYEGGPGLTVFPTGDAALLRKSITEKLLELPGDTVLLSGHSQPMTVEQLARVMTRQR